MKKLILFMILFLIYGCKEKYSEGTEHTDASEQSCKISDERGIDVEYHYYLIDSNDYPLIYAIVNDKIMKGKEVKDYLFSIPVTSPIANLSNNFIWRYDWTRGFYSSPSPFFSGVRFTFPFIEFFSEPLTIYNGGGYTINRVNEKAEDGINELRASSGICEMGTFTIADACMSFVGSRCYSEDGCVFGGSFFYLNECVILHPECSIYTGKDKEVIPFLQKDWACDEEKCRSCPVQLNLPPECYLEGSSLPAETEFEMMKGKFLSSMELGCASEQFITHTFIWETEIREDVILGIFSVGVGVDYISMSFMGDDGFTPDDEIFLISFYLKIKGETSDDLTNGIHSLSSALKCEEERMDRCIYERLKIEEIYHCLENGVKRIKEEGFLFLVNKMDFWKGLEGKSFKKTYLSPPISCSPGYPSPLTD